MTRIETLTRDPYAVWARDILRLYPLARPDEPVEVKARGSAIHKAFEDFAAAWASGEPDNAPALFQTLYEAALVEKGLPRASLARERALAREAGVWATQLERDRRADGRAIHVERKGVLALDIGDRVITITARADRIEVTADGRGHVLDFKTGGAPSRAQIDAGFSPQLTLTAAILQRGGFGDFRAEPGDLTYLRVTGRKPPGEVIVRKASGPDSEDATAKALDGVVDLLTLYEQPQRGYPSKVAPQWVKEYPGDYDHLARVFEWSTGGDGEGGEE